MRPLFYDGKEKALTFSYDDGVTQDRRLVEIFNKYGMKGAFNLNSGKFSVEAPANGFDRPVSHNKIDEDEVAELYAGHEVAVHTLSHCWPQYLSSETLLDEVMQDRQNLEGLVGYPVDGMAYPYGTYNELTLEVLRECGIRYSRTVQATKAFGYPADFLEWHPTCHFGDSNMMELADQFLELGKGKLKKRYLPIFYVWGHSYELDGNDTWDLMEEFCQKLSGQPDIWYATNGQLVDYYEALAAATYSADKTMVKNNSSLSLWFEKDGQAIEVKPGEIGHF